MYHQARTRPGFSRYPVIGVLAANNLWAESDAESVPELIVHEKFAINCGTPGAASGRPAGRNLHPRPPHNSPHPGRPGFSVDRHRGWVEVKVVGRLLEEGMAEAVAFWKVALALTESALVG